MDIRKLSDELVIWAIVPFVVPVIVAMAYWDNWKYGRFVKRLARDAG